MRLDVVEFSRPVVDRQLPTFFASPKKVGQKRRPRYFGNPDFSKKKREKFETRLRLKQRTFLILFPLEKSAELEVGVGQNQLQRQLQKQLHDHESFTFTLNKKT
ncbi:hypothetical protein S2091_3792 [Solimicrobium silvestre]|uniref:Uncharacterized protein n=1 Tax=Solimicrobium silvestre TaxID=2099400 RepID=A0A2S9GUX9_9BURK|nr:hypothetical protein S2091_3792 [Solimicrobium silvestre]